MKTIITIEVTHDKPVPDLIDKIAGRAYTIDGVKDVTATLVEDFFPDYEIEIFSE